MRFLLVDVHGDDVAAQFREHGHVVVTPIELGLEADVLPKRLREVARKEQYELVVADRAMLDALLPGSARREVFGRVIVFLHAGAPDHALSVARLFDRYKRLTPGRLYTVTGGRVKVAQLPTGDSTPASD